MARTAELDQASNPYRSTASGYEEPLPEASLETQVNELRFFVGSNADYFLRKWLPRLEDPSGEVGMNWLAVILTAFWFAYRKMYLATFLLYAVSCLLDVVLAVVFMGMLKLQTIPGGVILITNVVASIICGLFANAWYLSHARRAIATAHSQGLEGDHLLYALSQRGGTSLLAAFGLNFLALLVLFVVGICLAMFGAILHRVH